MDGHTPVGARRGNSTESAVVSVQHGPPVGGQDQSGEETGWGGNERRGKTVAIRPEAKPIFKREKLSFVEHVGHSIFSVMTVF